MITESQKKRAISNSLAAETLHAESGWLAPGLARRDDRDVGRGDPPGMVS